MNSTSTFENPSNGYRVSVSDGSAFIWTLLFGGLYFLARGSTRHFIISWVLAFCTFGLSWLIYPFFAADALRKMYYERGYRLVETTVSGSSRPANSSSSIIALLFLAAIIGGGYWFYWQSSMEQKNSASDANAHVATSAAARQFTSAEEAKREAVRKFPELGIAGSKFNNAFLARHKFYQQTRPEYLNDPSWPMRLAEEVSRVSVSR